MLISHTALSHSRATASLHKTTTQSLSLHQTRHTIQTHSSPPLPTHSDIQIAARFFRVSGGSDPIGGVVGYRPSTSPAEDATPTDFNPPTSLSTASHFKCGNAPRPWGMHDTSRQGLMVLDVSSKRRALSCRRRRRFGHGLVDGLQHGEEV